jgi:transposase
MITNTTGETVMTVRKNNKATKIRKLVRMGLAAKEITAQLDCSLNYVYLVKAAMSKQKVKVVPPPTELGLASLTPDPAMNAYEGQGRKVSAYRKAKIKQIAAQRTIDKRHQLIERFAKGALYVASAGVCVAIAYVFTL